MKTALIAAAAVCLLATGAAAQTLNCTKDMMGGQTCRGANGERITVRPDPVGGGGSIRDQNGNASRYSTDPFGNTTVRDAQGNTVRGRQDNIGNGSTWRDINGNTTRCRVDGLPPFERTVCR